jgi:hypothetical protein
MQGRNLVVEWRTALGVRSIAVFVLEGGHPCRGPYVCHVAYVHLNFDVERCCQARFHFTLIKCVLALLYSPRLIVVTLGQPAANERQCSHFRLVALGVIMSFSRWQ